MATFDRAISMTFAERQSYEISNPGVVGINKNETCVTFERKGLTQDDEILLKGAFFYVTRFSIPVFELM